MKKLPVIIGAAALLLLGAGCSWWEKDDVNTNTVSENQNQNLNTNIAVNQNTNANRNQNQNVNTVPANTDENQNANTNANTNSSRPSSGSLTIEQPEAGDEIESPFEVRGTSSAATVYVRLRRAGGSALFTVPVTVRNGEYRVNLTFEVTNTTEGIVEVFEKDASDRESTLVSAAVTFKSDASGSANANSNANSNANTSPY